MIMHLTGPLNIFVGCHLWLAVFELDLEDSSDRQRSELKSAMMSCHDLARWQRFRSLEKKRQFLNSRIAVRSILQQEFGHSAENVELDKSPSGQPILTSAVVKNLPQISLSHSGSVVAVVMAQGEIPVGVDIEVVEPLRTSALRLIAANPCEVASFRQQIRLNETEFVRTLWTIKESVWKSLGCFSEIMISDIVVHEGQGVIIPCVVHPFFFDHIFQTKLFAVQCEPIFADTLLVDQTSAGVNALRGSVSRRIPEKDFGSSSDFSGKSLIPPGSGIVLKEFHV